jgi:manganese/zinc/iron transport system permease protein
VAGWLGTLLVMWIIRMTRIKDDTALGIVLSVFFGFGLVLLTFVQKMPDATQAGLDKFLFGQAAALLAEDVRTITIVGLLVLAVLALFWKEFKLLTFDADFAATLGFGVYLLDVLLTGLLVLAIVLGLQTVGVVLMSAMVVAPAAAARQWTDRLSTMVVLSAVIGAASGVAGAVVSSASAHLPTGPTIVICATGLVAISMFLAPRRGLLWKWVRHQRNRQQLQLNAVLGNLFELASQHRDPGHGHSLAVLRAMSDSSESVKNSLKLLAARGLVTRLPSGSWALTPAGHDEAQRLAHSVDAHHPAGAERASGEHE